MRPPRSELSCAFCDQAHIVEQTYEFAVPNSSSCPAWDVWKFGLGELNNYMYEEHGADIAAMVSGYGNRTVLYGVGENDHFNDDINTTLGCAADYPGDSGLDSSCGADLQGYCRLERTVAFFHYVHQYFPRVYGFDPNGHQLMVVPDFGHCPCGLLQSSSMRTVFRELFEPS